MSTQSSSAETSDALLQRLKVLASLWRVWLLGIATTALFGFAVISPAMGEGYFYELMFGGIALVAFVYGGREIARSDNWT